MCFYFLNGKLRLPVQLSQFVILKSCVHCLDCSQLQLRHHCKKELQKPQPQCKMLFSNKLVQLEAFPQEILKLYFLRNYKKKDY